MFFQSDLQTLLIVFGSILFSMSFHEAMHAFASYWLGDPTAQQEGRLNLNPLKHIDIYLTVLLPIGLIMFGFPPFFIAKPVPFNPYMVRFGEFGSAIVGVVGPLINLLLASVASVLLNIFAVSGGIAQEIITIFIVVNVSFFVFNMIPFPPLDGSRLLYAVAPQPLQKLMYQIEQMGLISIMLFMFLIFPLIGSQISHITNTIIRFLL